MTARVGCHTDIFMSSYMQNQDLETVRLDDADSALVVLDQTELPRRVVYLRLYTTEEIREAICSLRVRGAPAIGVAAACGLYLAAKRAAENYMEFDRFCGNVQKARERLASARPTAVNLSWALERMSAVLASCQTKSVAEAVRKLHDTCEEIRKEDIKVCEAIGEYGLQLLRPGDGVLTHCNAGQLAAVRYGTATAPLYLAHQRGYHIRVYTEETRPLLQGARLTAFELHKAGLDVTLVCDNMSAALMRQRLIQAVFVGCDRVAANGDTANKIGTAVLAAVAKQYGVPFYVCAPTATVDLRCASGDVIPIEERDGAEITELWYRERMAPEGIRVWNPAFDVTDHSLITAFVTEKGIVYPPFTDGLAICMK